MSIKKSSKTYIQTTGKILGNSSRLNIYNIFRITETGQSFLNHFRSFEIVSGVKNDNAYFDPYTVLEDDWWDNISYQSYGTSSYWYLLCLTNDVVNPYEELITGTKVKVLKGSYLYQVFKGMKEISKL